jgi:Flp pilus assembly CpaE family ATPase
VDCSKLRLVVNRYNPDVGLNQEAIETALHWEVFHLIPSDYESVQRALVEGKPILPGSIFGKNIAILAERLAGKRQHEPKKKASTWSSLFSSLVSRGSNA